MFTKGNKLVPVAGPEISPKISIRKGMCKWNGGRWGSFLLLYWQYRICVVVHYIEKEG